MKKSIFYSIIWFIVFLSLILGFAFRYEIKFVTHRFLSVLIPFYDWENENGELVIIRHMDSHFYIKAYSSDGKKVKFLIDTGATDIALNISDAIALGIDVNKLRYNKSYMTANGVVKGAFVTIKFMKIGKKIFYDLPATVLDNSGMDISLMGMSFLDDFANLTITQDTLLIKY